MQLFIFSPFIIQVWTSSMLLQDTPTGCRSRTMYGSPAGAWFGFWLFSVEVMRGWSQFPNSWVLKTPDVHLLLEVGIPVRHFEGALIFNSKLAHFSREHWFSSSHFPVFELLHRWVEQANQLPAKALKNSLDLDDHCPTLSERVDWVDYGGVEGCSFLVEGCCWMILS